MNGKSIDFYTTRDDILPVIDEVESQISLTYMKTGNFTEKPMTPFATASDIPDIGFANRPSSIACESYLFTYSKRNIEIRIMDTTSGIRRFLVDQLINPDSAILRVAGRYSEDTLIAGSVTTTGNTKESIELVDLFRRSIKSHFRKIKCFCVGPEAMKLKDSGFRLTKAIQSPAALDLK